MNSRTFLGQGWGVEGSSKAGQGLQPVGRALPGVGGVVCHGFAPQGGQGQAWRQQERGRVKGIEQGMRKLGSQGYQPGLCPLGSTAGTLG